MAQLSLPDHVGSGPVALNEQGTSVVLLSGRNVWSVDDANERYRRQDLAVDADSVVVSGSQVYGITVHPRHRATRAKPRPYSVEAVAASSQNVSSPPAVTFESPVVSAVAGSDGSLWAAQDSSDALMRIKNHHVVARVRLGDAQGSLQLTSAANTEAVVLDTRTLRLMVLPLQGAARSFSTGDRAQAVTDVELGVPTKSSVLVPLVMRPAQTLVTVNTRTGALTSTQLPAARTDALGRPVASGSLVYVPDETSGTVLVVDTASGRLRAPVRLPHADRGRLRVFVENGLVWGNDETGRYAMVVCQGRTRVFAKYGAAVRTSPTSSGGPSIGPSPSVSSSPTPSPDASSATPRVSQPHPSPSPSPSGSSLASARPSASGSTPTDSPGGNGPTLLKTITVASSSDSGRTSFAWDPAGARLVTAHGPDSGELWDVSNPRTPHPLYPVTDGRGGYTSGTAFADHGNLLFVAGRQTSTYYQDFTIYSGSGEPHVLSSKVLAATQDRGLADILAVRPDGGAFAVDDGGDAASNVTIWSSADPRRPVPVSSLSGMITIGDAVESVAFSPDGATVAVHVWRTHAGSGPGSRFLYMFDVSDIRHPSPSPVSSTNVGSAFTPLEFSPDGRLLLAPGIEAAAALWDVRDLTKPVGSLPTGSSITAAAFSHSGAVLATGEQNGTVKLWKVALGQRPVLLRTVTRRPSSIHDISFDPRTGLLGVADGTTVQLWKTN
ncbi:WD40 repeat domain-containing protein [Streptomyces sp. NPDC059680]|uniref:WD40 repeat domain-containing protein n=1 Tax=Streptomyces sp. NPDC059680 TaxID=3346904 RepID=UPI0036847DEF